MVTDERRAKGGEKDLAGAYLRGANLAGAYLIEANLAGANLYEANLYGADLGEAYLGRANMTGANLYEANLYGAALAYCVGWSAQPRILGCSSGSGYQMLLVRHENGECSVQAGCRVFTLDEARRWWGTGFAAYQEAGGEGTAAHLRETQQALDYLLALAASRGWTIPPADGGTRCR